MLCAEPDVGIGGKMKNEIASAHRVQERIEIQHIALHHPEGRTLKSMLNKSSLPRRVVVISGDVMTIGQQTIRNIATDESRGARNEKSQAETLLIDEIKHSESFSCHVEPYKIIRRTWIERRCRPVVHIESRSIGS